jgi:hypothetical protein
MKSFSPCLMLFAAIAFAPAVASATMASALAPHKALYDIDLIATHSGSQILNISGQMTYEWKPSCDAWLTDHHFKLFYEYADSPGMRITSDFSTFESFDGKNFNYTSRRQRDGKMYQEIRGSAELDKAGGGKAVFTMPEGVKFDLVKGSLFPMGHTLEVIKHAEAGDKFYSAQVFDGSDEEGPIEINTFIGKPTVSGAVKSEKIDESLLKGKAWNMRMAVFQSKEQEEESDYEMEMVFHQNGIISDMTIEYDDFSVTQKLVSLEKLPGDGCASPVEVPKKP